MAKLNTPKSWRIARTHALAGLPSMTLITCSASQADQVVPHLETCSLGRSTCRRHCETGPGADGHSSCRQIGGGRERFECCGGWVNSRVSASIRAGTKSGRLIGIAINSDFGGCFKRISTLIDRSIASINDRNGFTSGVG